jgi:hypothetical protein
MLSYSLDANQRRAARAIRSARKTLVGLESNGVRVASVFHYGEVDIDPKHLVVWVLLSGRPDEELPAWLRVTPSLLPDLRPKGIDFDWLLGLRYVVVRELAKRRWPSADVADVMVDSQHRVETNGGRNYFR